MDSAERTNSRAVPPETLRQLWARVACDRGEARSPTGSMLIGSPFVGGLTQETGVAYEHHRNGVSTPRGADPSAEVAIAQIRPT